MCKWFAETMGGVGPPIGFACGLVLGFVAAYYSALVVFTLGGLDTEDRCAGQALVLFRRVEGTRVVASASFAKRLEPPED